MVVTSESVLECMVMILILILMVCVMVALVTSLGVINKRV